MKKHWKEILFVLIVIVCIGYIFLDSKRDVAYRFRGEYRTEPENISVDVFVMKNGKGDLLTYNTNIFYSETEIKGTLLYYLKNNEKQIFLGGSTLNSFYITGKNNPEYGDYLNEILDNENNLYFDLCRDVECKDVLTTLKLEKSKLFY